MYSFNSRQWKMFDETYCCNWKNVEINNSFFKDFIQNRYYGSIFTSLLLKFLFLFVTVLQSIYVQRSSGKPWNFKAYRWIVNMWWKVTVEMWLSNNRKREYTCFVIELCLNFLIFNYNRKVCKWCFTSSNFFLIELWLWHIYLLKVPVTF